MEGLVPISEWQDSWCPFVVPLLVNQTINLKKKKKKKRESKRILNREGSN